MPSFNRVILIGNSTRDLEIKETRSGTQVVEMGLAINEKRKQGEQYVDETVFVDITLWGKTAEIAVKCVRKGQPVLIEGRLKLDIWDDKNGQKRSKLKVVGERLALLGSKQKEPDDEPEGFEPPAPSTPRPTSKPQPPRSQPIAEHDDIPFLWLWTAVAIGTLLGGLA